MIHLYQVIVMAPYYGWLPMQGIAKNAEEAREAAVEHIESFLPCGMTVEVLEILEI